MNFDAMKCFLTRDTTPALLSKDLDDLIFDFTMAYGQSNEALSQSVFADHIYRLKELRDIFADMQQTKNPSRRRGFFIAHKILVSIPACLRL